MLIILLNIIFNKFIAIIETGRAIMFAYGVKEHKLMSPTHSMVMMDDGDGLYLI